MCSLEEGMRNGGLCEEFNQSQAMAMLGKMVVQKNCIIKHKRPKVCCHLLWTMQHCMNEHCAAPHHNSFDCALGHAILVVHVNTTEALMLWLEGTIVDKCHQFEGTIDAAVTLGTNIKVIGKPFKGILVLRVLFTFKDT
eukprot:5045163-Ditylum_brightwellii.AAC.1